MFKRLLTALGVFFLSTSFLSKSQDITPKVLHQLRSCVAFDSELQNKGDMLRLIQTVEKEHFILESGDDDLRNKYVYAQGCFEHALACLQALGDIQQLVAVIHTPTLATPLCVRPEGPVEAVLDASIRKDRNKLLTVRARTKTLREYLSRGGNFYMAYPKGGEEQRNANQRAVYQEELATYSNLIDTQLTCPSMDPEIVGATYLFRTAQGEVFAFSIKSRQAIDIQQKAEWGIWFGNLKDPVIAERVNGIMDYLIANGCPDLRTEI